jgi:hypothetical protein
MNTQWLSLALLSLSLRVDAADVSFARDIAPVLEQRCSTCHLTGEEPGGIALYAQAAYAALVDAPSVQSKLPRIKPGHPDESYLLHKLEGTHTEGVRMPMGSAPLSAEFIQLLREWIAAGAPDS